MSAIVSRMPIFQSAMREFDDFDRRQGEFDRAQNVGDGQMFVVEVAPDDEGDLGLDLGLDQLVGGHVPPVRNRHVVEQHAVIGLTDAELALHGERGEADLTPDQSPPGRKPAPGVDVLGGVGLIDRARWEKVRTGLTGVRVLYAPRIVSATACVA